MAQQKTVTTLWDVEDSNPKNLGTTGGGGNSRGPNHRPGGLIDLEGREPPYAGRTGAEARRKQAEGA